MSAPSQEFRLWLSGARDGSPDALGRALDACRSYLLFVARNEVDASLQAKGGASDLVQETFLEAHRAFDRFHGTSEVELRSWLRRLLHHQASKFRRRYRTTQKRLLARETPRTAAPQSLSGATELPAPSPTPSTQLMVQEQAQRLRQALERLPHDYRWAITLRYVEQCSFEEIGRRMHRTPNAARLLWLRAIERVRHELRVADES
jgi:RNA polymerase sigma-70 factor (ECF subfamily)